MYDVLDTKFDDLTKIFDFREVVSVFILFYLKLFFLFWLDAIGPSPIRV